MNHGNFDRNKKFLSEIKNYTKTLLCVRVRGSITAEAALVVPIFVLFLVLFLGIFRVEQVELKVNQALNYTASVMAIQEGDLLESLQAKRIFIEQLKTQECEELHINDGWKGIDVTLTESDKDFVRLAVTYEICLPVNLFGKQYVEVTQSAAARRWTGSGKRDSLDGSWVYITPYGTAYHNNSACRYLDLTLWATSKLQVAGLRNKDGGKYEACRKCVRANESISNTVYVTDYGDLYHQSIDCSRLKRSVYRVQKDTVTGRTPCKKCYGGI